MTVHVRNAHRGLGMDLTEWWWTPSLERERKTAEFMRQSRDNRGFYVRRGGFCFISSTCVDLWGEGAIGGWSNTASPEAGGSTEDLGQHAGVTYVVIDNLSLAMARIYLPGIFFLWQIWLPVEWRSCETVLEERTNSAQRLFQLEYGLFRASAADSVF